MRANVNLIRYNEVEGVPFARPTSGDVHAFQEVLRAKHVNVHIRASRGRDIAAACGQLRHEARV
jgi:23S rRNA (adenine2503-C2)-methyltransferase